PSQGEYLSQVRAWLIDPATRAHLSPEELGDVHLAVTEACANIIEHAYGGRSDRMIFLTATARDDRLSVTIRDTGAQFDPSAVRRPDLEETREGGYGMYLMDTVMDSVDYDRSAAAGTRLTLVKTHRMHGDT
ncbi:MAG TPA: ATP-binding protein, partial [Herpetosiphonaceae bacterium]|nr:ATP-binding protein [Herpetosiphonaceae bacterium]